MAENDFRSSNCIRSPESVRSSSSYAKSSVRQSAREKRARSHVRTASVSYKNGDLDQCIRLTDKAISLFPTLGARKLRAAALQARSTGVKEVLAGKDGATPQDFPMSPTVSFRGRSKTYPKVSKSYSIAQGSTRQSFPLNPPKLQRARSQFLPRTRLSWPRPDSPMDENYDRKRLRRSHEEGKCFDFGASFLETLENEDSNLSLATLASDSSSMWSFSEVEELDFDSENRNGSNKLRKEFKHCKSAPTELNISKCLNGIKRSCSELIAEKNYSSPLPSVVYSSPPVMDTNVSTREKRDTKGEGSDTRQRLEVPSTTVQSATHEQATSSSKLTYATPTREELMTHLCTIDVSAQIEACKKKGIKMVALDFDMTLICIHTNGKWNRSASELSQHIRPVFRSLVPALLSSGIMISIVTFSPQVDLVERVVNLAFTKADIGTNLFVCGAGGEVCGKNTAAHRCKKQSALKRDRRRLRSPLSCVVNPPTTTLSKIPCSSKAWSPTANGKCRHINTALQSYYASTTNPEQLSLRQILLIDDDKNNVNLSKKHGIRNSIWFRAAEGNAWAECKLLEQLTEMPRSMTF